ncbi:TetR family transcriptional regulator [Actinoplanes sp. SE50]|uniref:TetR/AcrR family transcriptional regulator n=1 Tax=unclassified Actinoplanes TaxID=2626549 RepID=UPI00023EC150|nr:MULTISPECIES: TetR family transcriptional regulator [unclassified Actinoplanes]AEV86347.1 HTH-type transcriptional regulator betI [Actinoplanes sp. SE50/110]ATO84744.1 TetR family transcriptional regulator [Actinoplanes sp. SE50]SLM02154.1 TetR family transcriptional regulator [Actinoplanes sp. SE50/110]
MARRTGRRPGNPDTRESILNAAREAFADKGYDGASIRVIAAGAGVDPALVHHYFGTKDKLFLAAMQAPMDPVALIEAATEGGPDEVGDRFVRLFLRIWDGPGGAAGVALLRSTVGSEWTTKLFREFVVTQILRRAVPRLGLDETEGRLRVTLAASQMVGIAMARYVIKVEPLASAPAEAIVAAVGPAVQRYLTGELPGVFASGEAVGPSA